MACFLLRWRLSGNSPQLVDSAQLFFGVNLAKTEARSHDCERCTHVPRGRPVRHDLPQVSSLYERRRQSARVLRVEVTVNLSHPWIYWSMAKRKTPPKPALP